MHKLSNKNIISPIKKYNQFGRRHSFTKVRTIKFLKHPIIVSVFLIIIIVTTYLLLHNLIANTTTQIFSKLGLTVQNIYLSGQQNTPIKNITSTLNFKLGDNIFAIPIKRIKYNLEQIGWIDEAIIFRQLPDSVYISIIEKKPAALWQSDGILYLIDDNGDILTDKQIKDFANFIIIVGDDAPLYVKPLLNMLRTNKELYAKISSAIRIGERRWNIRFTTGLEIKLPELLPEQAWDYVINLYKQKNLFVNGVTNIDLRIPDKLYIK
ncbi:Cell division protein FtsQ [Rickettsiales bacterium Ac37b]|nr:Cell division protein FtsQ [Rickettsiales bacterium Ac37b]